MIQTLECRKNDNLAMQWYIVRRAPSISGKLRLKNR